MHGLAGGEQRGQAILGVEPLQQRRPHAPGQHRLQILAVSSGVGRQNRAEHDVGIRQSTLHDPADETEGAREAKLAQNGPQVGTVRIAAKAGRKPRRVPRQGGIEGFAKTNERRLDVRVRLYRRDRVFQKVGLVGFLEAKPGQNR